MLLKLIKWFIMALFGATVCSAAYLVPWYENDIDVDVDEAWGNANATTVCTAQINPQTCWANDIANHIFIGNPATCSGAHVASAMWGWGFYNVAVLYTSPNAGLIEMEWYTAPHYGGRRCQKTVWNDDPWNYPQVSSFTHLDIENICLDAIATTDCVSTPLYQGIVVDNQYWGGICISIGVGGAAKPGITCFPRFTTPTGAIGDICY